MLDREGFGKTGRIREPPKPTRALDLQAAFNDYLVSEDVETVIREIKSGKYRGTCARERREATRPKVGNLYGERKKAWLRFLEKHYPNVERPIHALRNPKLVKKIMKEFEEYYKKEYWKNVDAEKRG